MTIDQVLKALKLTTEKFERQKKNLSGSITTKGIYCRVGSVVIKIAEVEDLTDEN